MTQANVPELVTSASALALLGKLRIERVAFPGMTHSVDVARPVDYDRLIDEAAADPEQHLPYWSEIWPSGVALAARIARQPGMVRGKRVLEIGCGLGVTAIAALHAGADLLVADYAPEALALCAHNTHSQVGRQPDCLRINWRDEARAGVPALAEPFNVVLAADVLYERRDVEPLLAFTDRVVAAGGELWLAEPGRAPAARFLEMLQGRGWASESEHCSGPWPDPEDDRKGVVVSIHRLLRPDRG